MPTSTRINGPYGAEIYAVPDTPGNGNAGASALPPTPTQTRIPVTDATFAKDPGFEAARAAREDRANLLDSNMLVGIGAAMKTWSTARLIDRASRPSFAGETQIIQSEFLDNTPLRLTEDEREFFMDVGKGDKSAAYAIGYIEDQRMAHKVMGQHEAASLATMFIDPVWFAVPPAVRVGGRATTAATTGAIMAGVSAGQEGAVSGKEIALSFMMGSAAGAVFYKPGAGLVPKVDPDFPQAKVDAVIAGAVDGVQSPAPVRRMVTPETWLDTEIPGAVNPNFLRDFSNVFTEGALNDARASHVVMMTPDEYRTLAYPRDKTYADLSPESIAELANEKRAPIRTAITQGGLDAIPSLDIKGGRVVGHDGRHRADVLEENGFDQIPVRINGKELDSMGAAIVSETGETSVNIGARVESNLPGTTSRTKTADAVWEDLPAELAPGVVHTDPARVVAAVDTALQADAVKRGWGEKLQWNMRKTMSGYGPVGKRVSNLLFDNNSDLSLTSVEAHREAILSDLRVHQFKYEDLMRQAMAEDGHGLLSMVNPFTSRAAYAAQAAVEKQVQREMFRREQSARLGRDVAVDGTPARITAMADQLDKLHANALKEMKAAGVAGAENLLERPGYLNRKWNSSMMEDVIDKLSKRGLTREAAHAQLVDLVTLSLRRANRFDEPTARGVGAAIVDRALRKGHFEDSAFNAPASAHSLAEMRDVLRSGGMDPAGIERALNVMRVSSDEAGKSGYLKHRMDLDYDAKLNLGGEQVSIMDLIDGRVSTITDQYIMKVSTNSALARKGVTSRSDLMQLREDLLHDTPRELRDQARDLFDNSINHFSGMPAGGKVPEQFRLAQSYGRSIALAYSGLWQLTEYATAMGEYGLLKSMKYAAQEIPGFKGMLKPDADTASSLNVVLADHSVQSLRLRPFIAKFEDGYEMSTGSALQLSAQTAGTLVPFANAMKFVHHHQARMVGNLVLDRVRLAAGGDGKARAALAQHGLESPVMDKLAAQIKQHGFEVDKWDDLVWQEVRPAFSKMMDASVLHARLGDMPAFAAFDTVGKFIFTYRTFVLAAHNKVMAGNLARNGGGAVGLVLLYQFPLALAAVQAQSVISGKGTIAPDDLAVKAMGQMGGLGLFSEPLKWATGESNSIGAPGLIPVDRAVKLFQAGTNLDPEAAGSTALTMLPVLSAVPFMRGMSNLIKE